MFCSEENVYKLCQEVASKHATEIQKCFVIFVSNPSRTVPLWRQKAGKDEDRLVIWVRITNGRIFVIILNMETNKTFFCLSLFILPKIAKRNSKRLKTNSLYADYFVQNLMPEKLLCLQYVTHYT